MFKKILIIGSGGREHALGWKLKQSPKIEKLYFAPGNAGTQNLGENVNIAADDIKNLFKFVKSNEIDLTVVGPEAPLALGIVDLFEKHGLKIFGPTKKAAQLEASKAWSAEFMKKYNIPSPKFKVFSDFEEATAFIKSCSWSGLVVKVDGLALGKGVIIPKNRKEAIDTIKTIMVEKKFGSAGDTIIIQEKLAGQEVSLIGFCDGKTIIPLLPAQDHKRIFDNDKGPNTGGIGAYAPVSFVTEKVKKIIYETILIPTLKGLQKEGIVYRGVLYAGLMLTKLGPKVLEYNVRCGDPETQPQLMLLNSDLLSIINACIEGKLKEIEIVFHRGSAVCVVLTAKGYPGTYEKGQVIYGLDKINNSDVRVFQAGTKEKNGQVETCGGRVLGVTARGFDLKTALKKAYSAIGRSKVNFSGMHYRKDIGKKALNAYVN